MMDIPHVTELLNKQEAELTKLHTLLSNELEILKTRELSVLEQAAAEKEQSLTKINQFDQAISQQTTFALLLEDENFAEQVNRIVNLLTECKKQNEMNGQIINNSQIAINRFKGMLQKSMSNNTMTYDQKGRTNISNSSIGIKA
ncbi:MAG: flagellar protein FlgN [Alteromonadaceae bacterium]|nr:flagellar protein FlgN [Alteromonadaceae bacterium]